MSNPFTWDISVDISDFEAAARATWEWAAAADGRVAFAAGAGVWFAVERAMGLVFNPFKKALVALGMAAVAAAGGAFLADAQVATGYTGKGVPFEQKVKHPNAGYFGGKE